MASPSMAPAAAGAEAPWSRADGRRVVFLLDAASALERRILEEWIGRTRPATVSASACETVPLPPSRRGGGRALDPRLEASLATGDDPLLAPLRVAWLPPQGDGSRPRGLGDLLTVGDPRDPGRLRQAHIL